MGTIGNRLTEFRESKPPRGLRKSDLARGIKVSRSYITRLEQGEVNPSAELMFRIAEYFHCQVEDIFYPLPDRSQTKV